MKDNEVKTDNHIHVSVEERDLISVFMYGQPGLYSRRLYWNDIMPVVEKISCIRCAPESPVDHDTFYPRTFGMLSPEYRKPMVRINRCQVFEGDSLLHATFQAVVDFIRWYNQNKKS